MTDIEPGLIFRLCCCGFARLLPEVVLHYQSESGYHGAHNLSGELDYSPAIHDPQRREDKHQDEQCQQVVDPFEHFRAPSL